MNRRSIGRRSVDVTAAQRIRRVRLIADAVRVHRSASPRGGAVAINRPAAMPDRIAHVMPSPVKGST